MGPDDVVRVDGGFDPAQPVVGGHGPEAARITPVSAKFRYIWPAAQRAMADCTALTPDTAPAAASGSHRDDLMPQDPGLDRGGHSGRVDRHLPHRVGPDQDSAVQRAERGGIVPRALGRDGQALAGAKAIVATTSSADRGRATAAGRWSTARFQARRASSQPGSVAVTSGRAAAAMNVDM
jgi:hypothetical protein